DVANGLCNCQTNNWVAINPPPPHGADPGEKPRKLDENTCQRRVVGRVRPDASRFGRPVGLSDRPRNQLWTVLLSTDLADDMELRPWRRRPLLVSVRPGMVRGR